MSRANQWFVPGDGIAREVITADIQRYLGPDALVRPGPGNGEFEGRSGYWITAYRTLTSQMIQDLKMDSLRWQQEQGRQEGGRRGAYQDSDTHAARQHWGPSEAFQAGRGESRETSSRQPGQYSSSASSQYPPSEGSHSSYTTAPSSTMYASHGGSYGGAAQQPLSHAAPRTAPSGYPYGQPAAHASYSAPAYPSSGYSQQQPPDYNRQPPPPTHGYQPPSTAAAPGYYIASDGRQYPLQQQPRAEPTDRRRRPG